MNRRQFLTSIPMIGAAIVAAPVAAALAVKPEFAMGGTLAPGTPYLVGEPATARLDFYRKWFDQGVLTVDEVRRMEGFSPLHPIGDAPHKA